MARNTSVDQKLLKAFQKGIGCILTRDDVYLLMREEAIRTHIATIAANLNRETWREFKKRPAAE